VGALVHDDVGEAETLVAVLTLATADERLRASEDLSKGERLGHVVVAAQAEPGDDAARARPGASARAKLVQDASDALWCFIIQREVCGLRDWRLIVHQYGVPAEVQNRMGVFDGGRPRNSSPK